MAGPYVTLAFLLLAGRIAALGRDPVTAAAPPYYFTAEEARVVGRCRLHFTYPALARQASPVLAASASPRWCSRRG
jgi:hypothetical protein